MVQNYTALVWAERYATNGDFVMQAFDIPRMLKLLPLETFVAIRESTVPMVVEYHKIKKPKNSAPYIEITGRSAESILERRVSVNNTFPAAWTNPRPTWNIVAAKESDAAYLAARRIIGDVARYRGVTQVLSAVSPVNNLDVFLREGSGTPIFDLTLPNDFDETVVGFAEYNVASTYALNAKVFYGAGIWRAIATTTGDYPSISPSKWQFVKTAGLYEIKPGYLYQVMNELTNTNHRGIKAVRPLPGGDQIRIEIYNGANRVTDPVARNNVVFDAKFTQFDDATYLLGKQGSTNVGYVLGYNGGERVLKTSAPEPTGLARRVMLLDASTDDAANTAEIRKTRGLVELYKNNETALFDGVVSEQVAAGFNRDYFLGDILKLNGEYGLSENVRVAEFIRSSDNTGEKAYPTFEVVE